MRLIPIFILFAGCAIPLNAQASTLPRPARISVPVADLRGKPTQASATLEPDSFEESQLLYGDPVKILEEKNGWARVEAVDQMEWSHHRKWEGYPGWIPLENLVPDPGDWSPNLVVRMKEGIVREAPSIDAPARMTLSIGTRLMGTGQNTYLGEVEVPFRQLRLLDGTVGWIHADEVTGLTPSDPAAKRHQLVETARLFLGVPYYWGGRCANKVDCSGLVGLVYQVSALQIPRDAHEIWMKAHRIRRDQLSAGDLIFLFDPKNRKRVSHVMLYVGENRAIEGPGTGKSVREVDLDERLKKVKGPGAAFGTYLE